MAPNWARRRYGPCLSILVFSRKHPTLQPILFLHKAPLEQRLRTRPAAHSTSPLQIWASCHWPWSRQTQRRRGGRRSRKMTDCAGLGPQYHHLTYPRRGFRKLKPSTPLRNDRSLTTAIRTSQSTDTFALATLNSSDPSLGIAKRHLTVHRLALICCWLRTLIVRSLFRQARGSEAR